MPSIAYRRPWKYSSEQTEIPILILYGARRRQIIWSNREIHGMSAGDEGDGETQAGKGDEGCWDKGCSGRASLRR